MSALDQRIQELGFGLLETPSGFSLLEPTTGATVLSDVDREAVEAWLYERESRLFDDLDPVLQQEREHDDWLQRESEAWGP